MRVEPQESVVVYLKKVLRSYEYMLRSDNCLALVRQYYGRSRNSSRLQFQLGTGLVQDVLADLGVVWELFHHLMTYVDGVHVPLRLQVVERKLETCRRHARLVRKLTKYAKCKPDTGQRSTVQYILSKP